jgi:hypothetical protein
MMKLIHHLHHKNTSYGILTPTGVINLKSWLIKVEIERIGKLSKILAEVSRAGEETVFA